MSTDEQQLGPEAQRAAIAAWAERGKIRVAAWCSDSGVGGTTELVDRPGLTQALGEIATHRAGVLVVARRDRLARDVVIAATIERAARRKGALVVGADGVGNGDAPADQFMRTILDGAAYERQLTAARTSAALRALRARGFRPGEVPFGYAADETGRLFPREGERQTIERVRVLRAGGASERAIVRQLAAEGHQARSGKPLKRTQVRRILATSPASAR